MKNNNLRVLVIGASGMLGNAVMKFFFESEEFKTIGTVRNEEKKFLLPESIHPNIISGIDVNHFETLKKLFFETKPNIVINCIGIVKQLNESNDPLLVIPVNSILPHILANLCTIANARLIHISTDCVFSGSKGMYIESDFPDAIDLYGKSKYLGEVNYPNTITLRTSMVGHELNSSHGLVEWFLKQKGEIKGFSRAVFSGLPTVEIARIIKDFVLPNPQLYGVYHVSAEPINKFEFLKLVAKTYKKDIHINEDNSFVVDRSLNSSRFKISSGYIPELWPTLIKRMYEFH